MADAHGGAPRRPIVDHHRPPAADSRQAEVVDDLPVVLGDDEALEAAPVPGTAAKMEVWGSGV